MKVNDALNLKPGQWFRVKRRMGCNGQIGEQFCVASVEKVGRGANVTSEYAGWEFSAAEIEPCLPPDWAR